MKTKFLPLSNVLAIPFAAPFANTETVNLTAVETAFEQVRLHHTHGVVANYLVGYWLHRVKALVPHGQFGAQLEAFAQHWKFSLETLRRRMAWYRMVREGLAKLPYGIAVPPDELDRLVLDEDGDKDHAENVIEEAARASAAKDAAAMLEQHKVAVKNLAVNVRLEGVDEARHKTLTKIIQRLKRNVGAATFAARTEAFFMDWEKELPPLPIKPKRMAKVAAKANVPVTKIILALPASCDSNFVSEVSL